MSIWYKSVFLGIVWLPTAMAQENND